MDSIEEYFQGEYIVEKNRIKEIEELMKDVLKTLTLCNEHGWPYELDNKSQKVDVLPKSDGDYSFSTSTMILFVFAKFINKIDINSPVLPNTYWNYGESFKDELKKTLTKTNYLKYLNALDLNCKSEHEREITLAKDGIEKKHLTKSGTFGWNDPFSMSWIAELIVKDTAIFENVTDNFKKLSFEMINKAFSAPEVPILDFEKRKESGINLKLNSERRPSNHIFPLLRVIHLFKTLSNHLISEQDIVTYKLDEIKELVNSTLFDNLQNRINQQISYSVLQNSLFDTAELVMSLEGLILIDDKRRVDDNLLTKAFEILKINQKNNLYWRPLKPFVTSPQGDVLLPLSIEIANSLLRICKHLEIKKKYYFHEFFEIFENYSKWLLSNVSQCKIENIEYRGWRSEHVQKHNVIHPWETAQVVIYLMNYKSMIQERIAYKSLKKSGLTCYEKYVKEDAKIDVKYWTEKWDLDVEFGFTNCYKDILNKFIIERNNEDGNPQFSMLLYGPPGTGKSSIAEELAETLNWRLISITPSDFIKHGEADIEGRAKSIFKTLEEQKDCVILFDEIDRLILDRDSEYYSNQGDFYQFMTPSMLVKIKDLRTRKKSIFIIATNYEERIDSAIKRTGRIDEKYLVNTLNLEQRKMKIKGFLGDRNLSESSLELIAKKTYLYTFTELKTLVKSKCKNSEKTDDEIVEILLKTIENEEPTIKLLNYKRRFQLEKEIENKELKYVESSIFPYKEFLALLLLKLESGEPDIMIEPEEKKLIIKVFKLLDTKLKKHFEKDSNSFTILNDYYNSIKITSDDKSKPTPADQN